MAVPSYDVNIQVEINGETLVGESTVSLHPDYVDITNIQDYHEILKAATGNPNITLRDKDDHNTLDGSANASMGVYLSKGGVSKQEFIDASPRVQDSRGIIVNFNGFSKQGDVYSLTQNVYAGVSYDQVDVNCDDLPVETLTKSIDEAFAYQRYGYRKHLPIHDQVVKSCVYSLFNSDTVRNTGSQPLEFDTLDVILGSVELYRLGSISQSSLSAPLPLFRIKFKTPIIIEVGNTFRINSIIRLFSFINIESSVNTLEDGTLAVTVPILRTRGKEYHPAKYFMVGGSQSLLKKEYDGIGESGVTWTYTLDNVAQATVINLFLRGVCNPMFKSYLSVGTTHGYAYPYTEFSPTNETFNVSSSSNKQTLATEKNHFLKGLRPKHLESINNLSTKGFDSESKNAYGAYEDTLYTLLKDQTKIPKSMLHHIVNTQTQDSTEVFNRDQVSQRAFGTSKYFDLTTQWDSYNRLGRLLTLLDKNEFTITLGVSESTDKPRGRIYELLTTNGIPIGGVANAIVFKTIFVKPPIVDPDYRQTVKVTLPIAKITDTVAPTLGEPPIE